MTIQIKRGDTLEISGSATLPEFGTVLPDLTGWTGRSQLRRAGGELIAEMAFIWLNAAERRFKLYVQDTTSWPVGMAQFDIEFTSPAGAIISTRTERIEIVKDETQPAVAP